MIIKDNDPAVQPSFSLSNRIARFLWGAIWFFFVSSSPRPFHKWRVFWYRLFGARIGRHVHIYPSARIWAPWNLTIEDRVGIGDRAIVYNMAPICIGANAVISQGAHLCAGSHDIDSDNFQLVAAPINVGPYTWICAEAFVGPGVNIPDGCVLGARSVVMRSIDIPWTVWAGNPARRVRERSRKILGRFKSV